MNKFKVGQRVKIIRTGKTGEIFRIDSDDFAKKGWVCHCYQVKIKNEGAYWFTMYDLELIEGIIDEKETEYLGNVIKPFRNKVTYIEKVRLLDEEYIKIGIKDESTMIFPNFKKGTMYKGMKLNKKYTLTELGLEN